MVKKVTLDTIAREAGVSKSTVSRALHMPELLKPETVKRVLAVAKKLNYISDAPMADPSRKLSASIGLIVASLEDSIQSALIHGMQDAASSLDYGLLIEYSNHHRISKRLLINSLIKRGVSGIVFAGLQNDDDKFLREAADTGIPVVVTWETPRPVDYISMVGFDNHAAAYSIVNYLCSMGHRRIAIITAPLRSQTVRISQRYQGYLDALKDNYGPQVETFNVDMPRPTYINGKQAMQRIIESDFNPTAVFAVGDALAIGAIRAAHELNLRVPGDISIAGFDDTDISSYSCPSLTSVHNSIYDMGKIAVETLIIAVESGSGKPVNFKLDSSLVIRESCGPLAKKES